MRQELRELAVRQYLVAAIFPVLVASDLPINVRPSDWGFRCGDCPACKLRSDGWARYVVQAAAEG